jgi:ABC-type glycerol-3-phosphate transport system permease component
MGSMKRFGHGLVLFVLLFLTLIPFIYTLINSFKYRIEIVKDFWGLPSPFHWDNYTTAINYLLPYFVNSIIITTGIVVGVIFLASMAAYSFARFQFPGKEIFYFMIIMLLMIPGFLLLVPQFTLIKSLGLLNTYSGQIFPPMTLGATMATLLMREFFVNIPKGLFESAQMEGAGEWTIFSKIAIPLSMPIISVVAILNTITGWNNFIWPLVITSGDSVKPIILALGSIPGSLQQGLGLQLAGYVFSSLPLLIIFSIASRSFVTGLASGSVKG